MLRENGVRVANTSAEDLELDVEAGPAKGWNLVNDTTILSRTKDSVRGWVNISVDGEEDRVEEKVMSPLEKVGSAGKGPGDAMVEGEALGQVVEGKA